MIYVWKDIKKEWEVYDMRYIDKISKLFLLLILFSFDLSAQIVTTVDGYPVIDLSALSPLGAVLSYVEADSRRTKMNQLTPTNSTSLPTAGGTNGEWNAKMSIKFQVMRKDRSPSTDWANAWALCRSYDSEAGRAGEWRMPTQRELQMIWILHPQLIGKGGFTAFYVSNYWSASEASASYAWLVRFVNGGVYDRAKTDLPFVRCVRDLP